MESPNGPKSRFPSSTTHLRDFFLPSYNEWRVLTITTLTSVATVIGSGILALPVTLHHTSLQLFLIIFTIAYIAHIGTTSVAVELFQRGRLRRCQLGHNAYLSHKAAAGCQGNDDSTSYPYASERSPLNGGNAAGREREVSQDVTLFELADIYLPNPLLRYAFHIATPLSFLGLLVSYGLAGPQALWQITHPPPAPPTPPLLVFFLYAFVGTLAVVFFVNVLLPVFSSLTIVKGGLFIAVVIIVAALPSSTRISSLPQLLSELPNWTSAAVPFLMSTVALGGLSNTMPVTFRLLPNQPSRLQVYRYRAAVLLGLTICYLLNIGWVIAVMQVVPRDAAPGHPSLSVAFDRGQISTVPLIETLSAHANISTHILEVVAMIINLFILISTMVSFFVMAAGCKSYLDGAVLSIYNRLQRRGPSSIRMLHMRSLAYLITFGSMILTIVWNPDGFIAVLTQFTSFTLNLQSGALLFIMLYYSRKALLKRDDHGLADESGLAGRQSTQKDIPLALPPWTVNALILFGLTVFSFAGLLVITAPFLGIELTTPHE